MTIVATNGKLLAGGALAIAFQVALAAILVVHVHPIVGAVTTFLLGLPLGVAIARGVPYLSIPAVAILCLTGVLGPAQTIETPLAGRTVDLSHSETIPKGAAVAGYAAPGWRVATRYAYEERVSYGRGGSSTGSMRLAPLVEEGWTKAQPVRIWVAGAIRDSGGISSSHPQFWDTPGDEFVRVVGTDLLRKQLMAERGAKALGLVTDGEPLIVMRAPSVSSAVARQYAALGLWALKPIGAWALALLIAAVFARRRAAQRTFPALTPRRSKRRLPAR